MKNVTVGIVGLGYVGLPLALRCSEVGHKVIGFDISEIKVRKFNRCVSYISNFHAANLKKIRNRGGFATGDFTLINKCDVIILCVPTPLSKNREPDMSYINSATSSILSYLRKGQILCLESTTWPGTTDEVIAKKVNDLGLQVGTDIAVVYSPEREDPGNELYSTQTIPKIVSGVSKSCREKGEAFYKTIIDEVVTVSSARVAEMTKLLENIHRSVNISLMNEIKIFCDAMEIDIFEVINAAATKPFGFTPYFPGPGLGGHCIPVDPFYLSWKAREFGITTKFIDTSAEVNEVTHRFVFNKVSEVLNIIGKSISKSKVMILGVAYKPNVDDIRESASLALLNRLLLAGSDVSYCDPYVPSVNAAGGMELSSLDYKKCEFNNFDVVLILTDHELFDYDAINAQANLIIDCRGRFSADFRRIFRA